MDEPKISNTSMPPVKDLIIESFETFKLGWVKFLLLALVFMGIALLSVIPFILLSLVLIFLHPAFFSIILALVFIGIGLFIIVLTGWASSALIMLLNDSKAHSLKEYVKISFPLALPYLALSIVSALITIPMFLLLIIPGILVSILLAFARYELVLGKRGIVSSLRRSVYVVKSHFVQVFLRLFLIIVLSFIANLLVTSIAGSLKSPFLSGLISLVFGFILTCFSFCYSIVLYRHAEAATLDKKKESSLKWILLVDLLGIILAVFIGFSLFRYFSSPEFQNILKVASNKSSKNNTVSLEKAVYRASFIASCKSKEDTKYCTCVADSLVNNNSLNQLAKISESFANTKVIPQELDKAMKSCGSEITPSVIIIICRN